MSVESEVLRIQNNIAAAYAVVADKGGEVPLRPTSANLAAAVASIPAGGGFPSGGIIVWSGAANEIPAGWALCDGQNGTPDLRGRFVLGAGTAHSVGDSGGEEAHTLTVEEMPHHRHQYSLNLYSSKSTTTGNYLSEGSGRFSGVAKNTEYAGDGLSHNNMPPYYALCYIMKL